MNAKVLISLKDCIETLPHDQTILLDQYLSLSDESSVVNFFRCFFDVLFANSHSKFRCRGRTPRVDLRKSPTEGYILHLFLQFLIF